MNLKKYIYIKQNHFAYMYLKLTCYCKSTTVQFKEKREISSRLQKRKKERKELSAMKRHGGTLNACP